MEAKRRKELEARGVVFMDHPGDWLGLDEVERQLIDLSIKLGNTVRRLRTRSGLTQTELSKRLKTSRPRITDIETGSASLDQCVKALYALGGTLANIEELGHPLTEAEKVDRVQLATSKRKTAGKA